MTAGAVSIIGLVNPVVGTLLGVAFAHEAFGPVQAIGMALVLGGVLAGQRFGSRPVVPPAPEATTHPFSSVRPPEPRLRGIVRRAGCVGNWYDPDS